MFFLFGWGRQSRKNYGPTLPLKCPNCNNDVFLHLLHARTWFSLFFIPVLPYNSEYYLLCDICSRGLKISRSQLGLAKQMNQTTVAFLNGDLTQEQYATALDTLTPEQFLGVIGEKKGSQTGIFDSLTKSDGLRRTFEAQMDKESVDKLIANLSNKKKNVKLNSIAALKRRRDLKAVEPLIVLLKEEDEDIKGYSAEALGVICDSRAIAPLISLLGDKNYVIRVMTVIALGNFGEKRAVQALSSQLSDENEQVRFSAGKSISTIYSSWVTLSIWHILEQNTGEYAEALSAIGAPNGGFADFLEANNVLGPKSIMNMLQNQDGASLVQALDSNLPYIYKAACSALSNMASQKTIDALILMIRNHGSWLNENSAKLPVAATLRLEEAAMHNMKQYLAGKALSTIGEPAINTLIDELNRPQCVSHCQVKILHALADTKDIRALTPLLHALNNNSDYMIRTAAALALATLDNHDCLESLIAALRDQHEIDKSKEGAYALTFRLSVIDAIGTIGAADSKEVLKSLLDDENEHIRSHAEKALADEPIKKSPLYIAP